MRITCISEYKVGIVFYGDPHVVKNIRQLEVEIK